MAQTTEVKFGDFQTDQRYKKLERELKLASLRKEHVVNESIPCQKPHLSKSDTNLTKSSTNTSVLHNSKMDNYVVSSSKNLRNMFLKRNLTKQNSTEDNCLMMKPPATHIVPRTSNKSDHRLRRNSLVANQYTDSVNSSQNSSDHLRIKKDVVFIRWKIMLTERGQLAVKGILQCKTFFQTKPIVKRLTGTSVESACNDLYRLQGIIVDDDEELPEYVRGKFYNGFPDDWRNVHQLWKTFIQEGCRASFRWPNAIADSDDDLKSEVTDITYLYSESFKHDISDLKSFKKSSFDSECSVNGSQIENNKTFTVPSCKRRDSYAQTSISISENSFYNTNIQIPSKQYNICNAECDKTLEDLNLEYSDTKNKVALKGKLNTLLNNLLHKNCPKNCISEIIKIVECLNNVVLIESNESTAEDLKQENQNIMQYKETGFDSEKLDSVSMINNASMQSNSILRYKCTTEGKIVNNEIPNSYKLLSRKRNFTKMNEDNSNDSFESEHEIYAGTPRIPVGQLFKKRGTLTKSCKRRSKRMTHKKYDVVSKQHSSDTSSSDNSIDKSVSKQNDNIHLKGCGAKHETHFSGTKRDDINSNIQSTIIKRIDFDTSKEEQWNRLNNLNKDKSIHKGQKCFIKENSTPAMLSKNRDSIEKETNFDTEQRSEETKSDKKLTNENYTYCESLKKYLYNSTSKIAKPTITSSVPVCIKMKDSGSKLLSESQRLRTNVVDNENTSIKELNKENKNNNRTSKKSPRKSRGVKTDNSTFLCDIKKNIENHIEDQLGNVDSISSRMSQDNVDLFKDNQQNTNNREPKKLTAWVPKVLCGSELSLIFEGSLLNDAGDVASKKFQTDNVLRRVSLKVIETVNHELYELIGDLNDKKHAVPKKLVNDCRYGCPLKIEQFCRKWKTMQEDNDTNTTQDIANIGDINVGVSSKGRRIIRPLSYWTGERITFKNDNAIYSPGISRENCDPSIHEKRQRKNNSMETSSDESNDFSETWTNKTTDNNQEIENSKSRKSVRIKEQRKNIQKIYQSETANSTEKNVYSHKKYKAKRRKPRPLSSSPKNLSEPNAICIEPKLIKIPTKMNENTNLNGSEKISMNRQLSNGDDCIVAYFQTSLIDDVLSEDQESHV